jgi:acyl transferase domain-containing protein
MSLRVPGADRIDDFWDFLCRGQETLSRNSAAVADELDDENERFVEVCGELTNFREFDHEFFGYRKDEARLLDPQQRIFLECCWEALEQSGWAGRRESSVIGVFGSVGFQSYLFENVLPTRNLLNDADRLEVMLATDKDFVAARVAYKLSLTGPALTVQAACASSLVGIHMAAQSLILGECDMALAGGAAVDTSRRGGYHYVPGLIVSPEGRVRSYDRHARGTVPSAGAGVVLLKRLADAVADDDPIFAVVHGTSVTNDGGQRAGFTAPTQNGVRRAAAQALALAGISSHQIGYVEGHGSGTPLGDSTELRGLMAAYGTRPENSHCWLGSIKSNIGHLDVAAGVAGFMKAVLVAQRRTVPPSLNCDDPLEEFVDEDCCFRVAQAAQVLSDHAPYVGVSSLGLGGQNVHAILGPPPSREHSVECSRPVILTWVTKSEAAAPIVGQRIATALQPPGPGAADLGLSLVAGHTLGPFRSAALWLPDESAALSPIATGIRIDEARTTVGCFPGYGSRFVFDTSDQSLLQLHAAREVLDCACDIWPNDYDLGGPDVLRACLAVRVDAEHISVRQAEAVEHAAHLVSCVAAARQALAWGLEVEAWTGYSLGEFPAAVMAGIMPFEDALRLVILRVLETAQSASEGAQFGIFEAAATIEPLLKQDCYLAVDGGVDYCVVGGIREAVGQLRTELQARDIAVRELPGATPFHTPVIGNCRSYEALLAEANLRSGTVRFDSGLLGKSDAAESAAHPHYWIRHLSETLHYRESLEQQMANGPTTFVEFGPEANLTMLAMQGACHRFSNGGVRAATLWGPMTANQEVAFLTGLAQAWTMGARVDWTRHFAERHPGVRRVTVPTYPFQREYCWIEPESQEAASPRDRRGQVATAEASRHTGKTSTQTYPSIVTEMVALWSHELGLELGPESDFFQLGGDSFRAACLLSAIRKRWSVKLPMSLLMKSGTPRKLARYVSKEMESTETLAVERSDHSKTSFPPTDVRLRDFNDELRSWAKLVMAEAYDTIEPSGHVVQEHARLYDHVREIVEEGRLVEKSPVARAAELRTCEAKLLDRAGSSVYGSIFGRLFTLGRSFPQILQGEESGLYLTFEGGESSLANQAYRGLPETAETLEKMVSLVADFAAHKKPLKVLEIGGGLGIATERVVPILPIGSDYVFTDISGGFFPAISEKFPQIRCEILDLNEAGWSLARDAVKYDLILGSNALHCAASIPRSLKHLCAMLASDGALVLMETTDNEPWHLIALGTLPGFLNCRDFRTAEAGPFVNLTDWRRLCAEVGLEFDITAEQAEWAALSGQAAFIARPTPPGRS